MISVDLASEGWLDETAALTNGGFANHEVKRTVLAGQPLDVKATLMGGKEIEVGPVRAVRYVARKGAAAPIQVEPRWTANLQAPISRGQQVGTLVVADGSGWTDEIPLVALESVTAGQAASSVSKGPFAFVGIGFVGLWVWTRRKRKHIYGRPFAL
jgi:D-alanyl-D-alanine carboxypeptidase